MPELEVHDKLASLSDTLGPFPLLWDSSTYDAATFPFQQQGAKRVDGIAFASWIEVFRRSIYDFKKRAAGDTSVADSASKAESFAQAYEQCLRETEAREKAGSASTEGSQKVDCVLLCRLREQCLRDAGFGDIFATIKQQESEKALQLLPSVLRDLDKDEVDCDWEGSTSHSRTREEKCEEQLWNKIVRGVFAGNVFDLGATASAKLFEEAGTSFLSTRNSLASRKCAVDDLAATTQRLCQHHYKKALLFVDNAGSDVVLGMLPLARALIKKGTIVVMAANSVPSINDVTARELQGIVQAAGDIDSILGRGLKEGILTVVESGNDLPVIDLKKISKQLATASHGVDLVILEGMGRAIETNLNAELSCDKLNLGMIKHPEVATLLNGQIYDCVCKFTEAPKKP